MFGVYIYLRVSNGLSVRVQWNMTNFTSALQTSTITIAGTAKDENNYNNNHAIDNISKVNEQGGQMQKYKCNNISNFATRFVILF